MFIFRRFRKEYVPLNLSTLQQFVDNGRLDASQPINMRTLVQSGAVGRRTRDGVKLLATVCILSRHTRDVVTLITVLTLS